MIAKRLNILNFLILTLIGLAATSAFALERQNATLAILPFDMRSATDISAQKRGIKNMLTSRLAARAEVNIIDLELLDDCAGKNRSMENIQQLMKKNKADFLLTGTLNRQGDYFTAQAQVYARGGRTPLQTFTKKFPENDLITATDQLAWDIAEKIFGAKPPTALKPTKRTRKTKKAKKFVRQKVVKEPALPSFQTGHPDRNLKQLVKPGEMCVLPVLQAAVVRPDKPGSLPIVFTPSGSRQTGTGQDMALIPQKTKEVDMTMRAMDIGDVDGDGQPDVVIGANNQLEVFHLSGARLIKFAKIEVPFGCEVFSVGLADLDKNGRHEIYVSTIGHNGPVAFGAQWEESGFSYLFKDEKWFVWPTHSNQGMILAGQQGGQDSLFTPEIYSLKIISQIIQQKEKLPVPKPASLFDFSMADLDGDGKDEFILLDQKTLKVLSATGNTLWQGDPVYGGSIRLSLKEGSREMSIRTPTRILIADINRDQRPDVIIKRNLVGYLENEENPADFPRGALEGLGWDGSGLKKIWCAEQVQGYISGYQYISGGESESGWIYAGVVPQSGWLELFSNQDSMVFRYPLSAPPAAPNP